MVADAQGPVTVVTVIQQRIQHNYQGDENWYLLNRFVPLLSHFTKLSQDNGKQYHSLQWGIILTSALTAFLIGAEALTSNPFAAFIKAAGLLAAVLVTAFTSRLHLFNYLSKSTAYRDVKEKLVAEFFAMDAGLAGYETLTPDQKLTRIEKTCEALIAGLDVNWTALQSPSQGSGTSG